ncbi:MAG: hypothetical protein KJT03_18415, partial [Verrucomicrobiae bacterium]|nr:hypothetical protein [Verrucomicrobiae bacterium]
YEYRDPNEPNPGKLTNLSNRALVGTGDDILIGSFRVRGDGSQRIYARVGGPALAGAGIANFLADPNLELIRLSDQQQIGFNDSWKIDASDNSSQQTAIEATFIPPANDVEPALVAILNQEGFYSIVVRGVNDTTGFANVEIYDYPQ